MASRSEGDEEADKMDWGGIYTYLLFNANFGDYEQIGERSYPQIITIVANSPKEIQRKVGFPFGELPFLTGDSNPKKDNDGTILNPNGEIKMSDIDSICSMFTGL